MPRSSVVIVSPSLADANNGNWQTARRWAQLLRREHAVRIVTRWPDEHAPRDHAMLALHAFRSAPSIQAWSAARGSQRLAVVLTGTDLYGEFADRPETAHSLSLATRLVTLQDQAFAALPPALRAKAAVVYQSTTARRALAKSPRQLRAVAVGHLRPVKDPATLFAAAGLLADREDIELLHVGEAAGEWEQQARGVMAACPRYRWLGPLPHARARDLIQRAHVLVHASVAEGGAHVVMEAVRSGTPVLASRIDGNVGMLGAGYGGYFPAGDPHALAALLIRCRTEQKQAPASGLLARLRAQCDARAPLFDPEAERRALLNLVHDLLTPP
ncbi:selenoneine biosynthesis selenosugar synthase SenB [Ramlibacter humi]|uniref:selenoneine biosynthesis selenosugar synthase SenB n=1 Tax=Ramlibacter humi TaxID=2530451 RepID=UPI00142FF02E|nr:selenoneine biosynthesis selenosugar synthase SenB [Ramlibacter humi]